MGYDDHELLLISDKVDEAIRNAEINSARLAESLNTSAEGLADAEVVRRVFSDVSESMTLPEYE